MPTKSCRSHAVTGFCAFFRYPSIRHDAAAQVVPLGDPLTRLTRRVENPISSPRSSRATLRHPALRSVAQEQAQ
jgi:hypothetical protein